MPTTSSAPILMYASPPRHCFLTHSLTPSPRQVNVCGAADADHGHVPRTLLPALLHLRLQTAWYQAGAWLAGISLCLPCIQRCYSCFVSHGSICAWGHANTRARRSPSLCAQPTSGHICLAGIVGDSNCAYEWSTPTRSDSIRPFFFFFFGITNASICTYVRSPLLLGDKFYENADKVEIAEDDGRRESRQQRTEPCGPHCHLNDDPNKTQVGVRACVRASRLLRDVVIRVSSICCRERSGGETRFASGFYLAQVDKREDYVCGTSVLPGPCSVEAQAALSCCRSHTY